MLVHSRAAESSMVHDQFEFRVPSATATSRTDRKASKLNSQPSKNSDLGPPLKDIFLSSREGDRFAVPVLIAVQLSSKLREFIASIERESETMGRFEALEYAKRRSLEIPCSTDVLKTLVDFFTAKLQLDIKLSEEQAHMSVDQQQEYWRDYFYIRIAWRMDLDAFADETLQVAEFLRMNSLYDLLYCCFRVWIMSRFDQADATDVYMD